MRERKGGSVEEGRETERERKEGRQLYISRCEIHWRFPRVVHILVSHCISVASLTR